MFEFHKAAEMFNYQKQIFKMDPSILKNKSFYNMYQQLIFKEQHQEFYRRHLDECVISQDFSSISSVELNLNIPSLVAVCSSFSLLFDINGAGLVDLTTVNSKKNTLMLNIFPCKNQTKVLFSWFKIDDSVFL